MMEIHAGDKISKILESVYRISYLHKPLARSEQTIEQQVWQFKNRERGHYVETLTPIGMMYHNMLMDRGVRKGIPQLMTMDME